MPAGALSYNCTLNGHSRIGDRESGGNGEVIGRPPRRWSTHQPESWQARPGGPRTERAHEGQRATVATQTKPGCGRIARPARSRRSAQTHGAEEDAPSQPGRAFGHRAGTTTRRQAHREIPCAQASRAALRMESSKRGNRMCRCTFRNLHAGRDERRSPAASLAGTRPREPTPAARGPPEPGGARGSRRSSSAIPGCRVFVSKS